MGTVWNITVYDPLPKERFTELMKEVLALSQKFDELYSRFKATSLVSKLRHTQGLQEVPRDLVVMLRIYQEFYEASEHKFTPCIGALLEDVGYDTEYSLKEKEIKREVPSFTEAIEIVDDTHIIINESVLIDVGAVGKGYCVDLIAEFLKQQGVKRFLVDGSGDIFYEGNGVPITVGLEHPHDTTKVVGSITMTQGSMCSSATNRRAWGGYSHYIDPTSKDSPTTIIATWVIAEKAAYADALSSVLFFVVPEVVTIPTFSYCCMNKEYKVKKSHDFNATFY